ncbi:DUF4265 domain-containing protein [Roseateles cellulosilyticus]|uniref:DUF4265 domain-containing protein n=1 Tax=Pelomonas cellulosilytica TaxID=2906762 RepID=A0ABS8XTV8_9BURK|nr:DUF4265 domain-containing protein [Pelomonas sp. P8]MCE4554266.1 DUF4265 domain-containing protein [Pelomonas sp. P8]
MNSKSKTVNVSNLQFQLDVEDDWPPVGIESLPFRIDVDGYKLLKPPLFVKGLSVGDVIRPTLDGGGTVSSWSHQTRSGRTTLWLLRLDEPNNLEQVLEKLLELGCNVVKLPQYGCYSIDVPAEVKIGDIDAVLDELNPEFVACAFPSMRHAED